MNQKSLCPVCGYDRSRDARRVPSLARLRKENLPSGGGRAPEPERIARLEARVAELEQETAALRREKEEAAGQLAGARRRLAEMEAQNTRRWMNSPQTDGTSRQLARINRKPDAPERQLASSAWMAARSADELWQAGKTPGSIRPRKGARLPEEISVPAVWNGRPVTRLEHSAFKNTGVRRVFLPEGLREIGGNCFDECWELAEISFPSTLEAIGPAAFRRCGKLRSVILPEGVTAVENETFAFCTSLREALLPGGVTKIGESAFAGCRQLERMMLPDGISVIRREAFLGCSLLRELWLPRELRQVEARAFYGCKSLRSLEFFHALESVADDAFGGCRLTDVVLPYSLKVLPSLPDSCRVTYR